MVTSAILLDCSHTFRAFFRVGLYPICCLGVVGTLLQPEFDDIADTRLVILGKTAAETELVIACAGDDGYDVMKGFWGDSGAADGIFAVWRRTPA